MKLLGLFKYLPYLGYRKKNIKSEPNEAYLFLGKQIYQLLKNKKHDLPRN